MGRPTAPHCRSSPHAVKARLRPSVVAPLFSGTVEEFPTGIEYLDKWAGNGIYEHLGKSLRSFHARPSMFDRVIRSRTGDPEIGGTVMNDSTKFRLVLTASLLTLCLPLTIRTAHSATNGPTLTGVVSCSQCHGMHARKGTNRLSCTTLCVSQGAHYVLLVGNKEYALEGDTNKIQSFGGGEATVTGRLSGNKLEVTNIGREQAKNR